MRFSGAGHPFLLYPILAMCLFLAAPPALLGQTGYQAQIRGVVPDPPGAVMAGATVTITEVGTNVSQTAKSDRSGEYILQALRPSTYVVTTQASAINEE